MPFVYLLWALVAQAAIEPPPDPDAARLDALVEIALDQNPEIRAAARRWEAAAAEPSRASSLPNPSVSFNYRNAGSVLPGTSVGEDPLSFVGPMVMQRFPFPGKLALRAEIARSESGRQGRLYDATRLNIVRRLKEAYFDLYQVERAIETVERNQELLDRFVSVARSRYEVGQGLQQDVLRAEVEATLIEERRTILRRDAGQLAARINQLLHRPPDIPVRTVSSLTLSTLDRTVEALYAAAEEANPVLDSGRFAIDRDARSLDLARKEHLPDFDVQVGRMFMGRFDDMWDVSISVEVPLFFWRKERRGVEEANFTLARSRNEFEAAGQELFRMVNDAYLAAESARRLERMYREAVIPQASLTLESSLTAYRVGNVDFLTVLDNWSTTLDLEIEYHRQTAGHEKALAALEELTGLDLISSGGTE